MYIYIYTCIFTSQRHTDYPLQTPVGYRCVQKYFLNRENYKKEIKNKYSVSKKQTFLKVNLAVHFFFVLKNSSYYRHKLNSNAILCDVQIMHLFDYKFFRISQRCCSVVCSSEMWLLISWWLRRQSLGDAAPHLRTKGIFITTLCQRRIWFNFRRYKQCLRFFFVAPCILKST